MGHLSCLEGAVACIGKAAAMCGWGPAQKKNRLSEGFLWRDGQIVVSADSNPEG
jgi:hypothetical protein